MTMELLKDLIFAASPSGFERDAIDVFSYKMEEFGADLYYSDKIGNRAYALGNGPVKVLLSAHIDTISGRIQTLGKDGVCSFINTNGLDIKSLLGSNVEILTPYSDRESIPGIIGKKPIHLESTSERESSVDFNKLRIDVGAESIEDLERMGIHVGCPVIHRREFMELGENRIVGTGLDDKVGVWIVLKIMEILSKSYIPEKYTIIGLASVQEETGCRGVKIASRNINPDVSIDFDATFAIDGGLGLEPEKTGDIKLGEGGVLSWGPDKSIAICEAIRRLSEETKIKFQHDASRCGGTNTSSIQIFSSDCETCLISIPTRNMHTPVEMCDKRDILGIIDLVVYSIKEGIYN